MEIAHFFLQFDRLSLHYECALQAKDEISFLDLTHSLRVWAEMKEEITRIALDRNINMTLHHHAAPKFIKQSLHGATHTYLPLASGVPSPEMQVVGLRITNKALSPDEIKQRAALGPPIAAKSKMSLADWFRAGVFEVRSTDRGHPHIWISREMIIKRVANLLGASHPAGVEDSDSTENSFDPYILELHTIKIAGGYPATYYQMLEIAGELLTQTRCVRDATPCP